MQKLYWIDIINLFNLYKIRFRFFDRKPNNIFASYTCANNYVTVLQKMQRKRFKGSEERWLAIGKSSTR